MPCLKSCLCLALVLMCFLCCQKEQSATMYRLLSFSDATRHYSVGYRGTRVSEIKVDSGAGAPFIIATYQYSNNYIRADLHESTGYAFVEYFFQKGTMPISVIKHKKINERDTIVSRTDFYYKAGTDEIDSVVLKNTNRFCFMPVFSGGNITDYYLSQDNKPKVIAGSFLYYPVANVFKKTNPLLFVYSNPVFEFETFLMPRLFSVQTMSKFNGGSFVYDTDAKGNLSLEDYGANVYPYRRTYIYE